MAVVVLATGVQTRVAGVILLAFPTCASGWIEADAVVDFEAEGSIITAGVVAQAAASAHCGLVSIVVDGGGGARNSAALHPVCTAQAMRVTVANVNVGGRGCKSAQGSRN